MRVPLAAAAFSLLAAAVSGAAAAPTAPEPAPRADASVRRALDRGETILDVIVGVRDGTPSSHSLAAHPDPAGEPRRRAERLAAQDALARTISPGALAVRRRYGSFSALAGRATREGVLALANRKDVAWITMDAIRRRYQSSPQASQVLIHSDQVNAAGIDGAGQTIAVLDTGVDYSVAELGGGGFPNAKVVGGADVADEDADPMDCDGHGTSVAAVAAGPAGVAPGARIVALKVARTASCDTAQDSDILAAIDWAVSNREAFAIRSINLSFGGAPADALDHGYCDDRLPQYVTAVEAANTAGIVFVASAGNEGLSNALTEPACLSAAISAGAVYPDSSPSLAWGNDSGGTLCTDQAVAADTVVCFSNSAEQLSLLAPGAFWIAPTRGGALEQFHGTSAAAPAVAGAVALLQQARPELSPGQIASLLRATGKPVFDPRSGVLTPRIDTLAAVELSPFAFASANAAVPIPDSGGFAAATATISGFAGRLAGVHAVVEIEHDDPRQLRISLTGPDGTTVLLHDHSGQAQHPINAVYGTTRAAAESLSAFRGRPANGAWTLTVEDGTPLVSGTIRNFAIRLLPEAPGAPVPAGAPAQVLPLVGRVEGARLFLSDVRLYNPGPQERTFSLFYVARGQNAAVRATRTVAAGRVLALDDVIGTEYGYADSLGQLTLLSSDARFLASSRAYMRGASGSFGVLVPAADSAAGFGQGQTSTVSGLASDARRHVNAGFAEVSGAPVWVRMDLLGGDGVILGSTTRSAGANGAVFATDIAGGHGPSALSNLRVDFTVTGGAGRIAPFAILVDGATGDGAFQAAASPQLSAEDLVIAQASHATGANADFFRTDLYITNLGDAPATVTLSLIPRTLTGAAGVVPVHAIAPGQTLEALDVLAGQFGLADPSAAGLRIHPSAPARLHVATRTSVEGFGGSFGFSVPGIPVSAAIGEGDGAAIVIQLDQTSSRQGSRANFGMAEVAGAPAAVRVTAVSGETGRTLGSRVYALSAGRSLQAGVDDLLGPIAMSNVYLRFRVESGAGRVLAYGASIDNASGDAIYVPALRE